MGLEEEVKRKMRRLGIGEEDLDEKFIRSSGPGGQKVNKSATCVFLRHRPSGMSVKCQRERSRELNRLLARRRLALKIEEQRLGRLSELRQKREKIRRQKRKRSQRAKQKMLEKKKMQGEKKKLRISIRPHDVG
jgi:protein subunit release factor B